MGSCLIKFMKLSLKDVLKSLAINCQPDNSQQTHLLAQEKNAQTPIDIWFDAEERIEKKRKKRGTQSPEETDKTQ